MLKGVRRKVAVADGLDETEKLAEVCVRDE